MIKPKQKKVLLLIIISALTVFLIAGLSIVISVINYNKSYPLNLDEWDETPFIVLNYDKRLGVNKNNGVTYQCYSIKGMNKSDWIYIYQSSGFPWTSSSSNVFKHKSVGMNPLQDWTLKQIAFSSSVPTNAVGEVKEKYKILERIDSKEVIQGVLESLHQEPLDGLSTEPQEINLLLIFKEHPNVAIKGNIIKSNVKFYLCVENKYYDIDLALSQYLDKYI